MEQVTSGTDESKPKLTMLDKYNAVDRTNFPLSNHIEYKPKDKYSGLPTTLNTFEYPVEGQPKAIVFYFTGYGNGTNSQGYFFKAFAEQGFVVYAFDRRGFG